MGFARQPFDVPRIDPVQPAHFERDYRRPARAVVLRGVVPKLEVTSWSFQGLAADFSDVAIATHRTRAGVVVADPRRGVVTEPRPLREVLAQLGGNGIPSLYAMARIDELPAAWRNRIPTPAYCTGAPWLARKLWLSPAGTVSMLHRDIADNIHVQLIGRKRFTLVDPEQTALLYPNSLLASVPNGCRFDLDAPDFARCPRSRDVQAEQADLEPGDAIYIPRGTWHHVRTIADSLSANFWWARGAWFVLAAATDLFKRLRGINR